MDTGLGLDLLKSKRDSYKRFPRIELVDLFPEVRNLLFGGFVSVLVSIDRADKVYEYYAENQHDQSNDQKQGLLVLLKPIRLRLGRG